MENGQHRAAHSLKPLGIGYLVWHCVSSLAILVILLFTTLAYAGVYSVHGSLPEQVSLMGYKVSAWLYVIGSWVILVPVLLAGITFGVSALTFQREHSRLGRAVVLGRVMFALCVINLLASIVQGDAVSMVSSVISSALTSALALEVRKESAGDTKGAQDAPRKTFVAESIDEEPIRMGELSDDARACFRTTSGYATVMLAWGTLRILYGVATLFSLPVASGTTSAMYGLASAIVIIGVGAFLVVAGRFGKTALCGSGKLETFLRLCRVGVLVAAGALALFVVLLLAGLAPTAGEVFCAVADLALCGAGLLNGGRLAGAISSEG